MTHTVPCEDRDFPEWHGGRAHALVWAVELADPELDELIGRARERCGRFLYPVYDRQPHVTLTFAGLAAEPELPGYGPQSLDADLAALRGLIPGGPIVLRSTGWDSFPMVPYLGVAGPWLSDAHEALRRADGHAMDYRPHVTIGHYRGRWPFPEVLAALGASAPRCEWHVTQLSLLRYDTHRFAGPLTRVGALDLVSGDWVTS